MSGLIAECIGISGSGKSTVAGLLHAELSRRGHAPIDRDGLIRLEMRGGILARLASPFGPGPRRTWYKKYRRPMLLHDLATLYPDAWQRCRSQLDHIAARNPDEATLLEGWIETKMACFMSMRAQQQDFSALIWEEGIAHRAVNLFASPDEEPDEASLSRLLRDWPFPDLLVHVHVDSATAFTRIEARGRPRRVEGRGEEEVVAYLDRSRLVCGAVLAEARSRRLPVCEIDNRGGAGEIGPELPGLRACVDEIDARLRAGPRSAV